MLNRKIQTNHSVCLLLPPVPMRPLVFAVASCSPKFTNESSQYLSVSCPKHNRTKQLSTTGVSECRSLALVAQHCIQTGNSSQERLHSSMVRTWKKANRGCCCGKCKPGIRKGVYALPWETTTESLIMISFSPERKENMQKEGETKKPQWK